MTARLPALIDLLEVREGIVCAVGAGGKKSVLYQLVREHPGRVGLTTTVHTTEFPADLAIEEIIDDEPTLQDRVLASGESRSVAYACPSSKPGRHAGVSVAAIKSIHDEGGFAATFVKADGARMRWIKAPAQNEPVTVPEADTVIHVVSAKAIGEPLSERVAHRVDRVEAVTGVVRGMPLTPEAVGRLIASEEGALYRTGHARVAPVINMVDDVQQEQLARAAATAAIAMTSRFDRVVLCSLRRPSGPVVAVVTR
jgi:probable selenium-dependent hydroxylase accessory protein YqeC